MIKTMPQIKIEITNPETDEPIMQWTGRGGEAAQEELGKMLRRWDMLLDQQEVEADATKEEE